MRSKGVVMNTGEKIDYMIQCLKVAKAEYDTWLITLQMNRLKDKSCGNSLIHTEVQTKH